MAKKVKPVRKRGKKQTIESNLDVVMERVAEKMADVFVKELDGILSALFSEKK